MKKPKSKAEKRNADRERIAQQRRALIDAGVHSRIFFLNDHDWAALLRDLSMRNVAVPRSPAEALRHYVQREPDFRHVAPSVLAPTEDREKPSEAESVAKEIKGKRRPRKGQNDQDSGLAQTGFLFSL